jgi:hypothetical protein
MPSRVLQVIDGTRVSVEGLSFVRYDGRILLKFVVDAETKQLYRIESLLLKLHGVLSIEIQAKTDDINA